MRSHAWFAIWLTMLGCTKEIVNGLEPAYRHESDTTVENKYTAPLVCWASLGECSDPIHLRARHDERCVPPRTSAVIWVVQDAKLCCEKASWTQCRELLMELGPRQ